MDRESSSAGVLSAQSYSTRRRHHRIERDRARLQTRTWVIGHNFASIPNGAVDTFGYDTLGRLTSTIETTTSGSTTTTNASWTYQYDADGNRTSRSRSGNTGAVPVTITYGYDAADELTSLDGSSSGFGSDANGNETSNIGSYDTGIAARTDTVNVRDQLTGLSTTNSDNSTGTTSLTYAGVDNTIAPDRHHQQQLRVHECQPAHRASRPAELARRLRRDHQLHPHPERHPRRRDRPGRDQHLLRFRHHRQHHRRDQRLRYRDRPIHL